MKKVLLGACLEAVAFAVLLLSESWRLPLTFALFAHLNAVFFFTRGFDSRLHLVHLRREVCFFFSLIFPLAGMAGIGFFILVLKRIEPRIRLPESGPVISAPAQLASEETAFLEDDYFSALDTAFVRKVTAPLHHPEAWHSPDESFPVDRYREAEYWRREKHLSERIRALEVDLAFVQTEAAAHYGELSRPGGNDPAARELETKKKLADTLLEYVTLFRADPCLREHYLRRASAVYSELGALAPEDVSLLEKQIETSFLNGCYRECLGFSKKLRQIDTWNVTALLRTGESLFRLREFATLAAFSREVADGQAVPAAVKEPARMWSVYG
jgi:hypothetical protein